MSTANEPFPIKINSQPSFNIPSYFGIDEVVNVRESGQRIIGPFMEHNGLLHGECVIVDASGDFCKGSFKSGRLIDGYIYRQSKYFTEGNIICKYSREPGRHVMRITEEGGDWMRTAEGSFVRSNNGNFVPHGNCHIIMNSHDNYSELEGQFKKGDLKKVLYHRDRNGLMCRGHIEGGSLKDDCFYIENDKYAYVGGIEDGMPKGNGFMLVDDGLNGYVSLCKDGYEIGKKISWPIVNDFCMSNYKRPLEFIGGQDLQKVFSLITEGAIDAASISSNNKMSDQGYGKYRKEQDSKITDVSYTEYKRYSFLQKFLKNHVRQDHFYHDYEDGPIVTASNSSFKPKTNFTDKLIKKESAALHTR